MKNPYRLSYDFTPAHYELEFTPDLKKFSFTGSAAIMLSAKKDFNQITLHALELKISKACIQCGHAEYVAKKISFDPKMETATFLFGQKIKKSSKLVLRVDFAGELNDKMHGFYRTSYKVDGQPVWGAATQFEATDARRAFPCWDEPDRKATFGVTLNVPAEKTALSNMPIAQEVKSGPLKKIRYEKSPVMPTYLLAIVVADLECVSSRDKNGVTIRVWTTPGKKAQGEFGLDVALHALPYFAKWFDIPYALPKMDMVALPDFASGAMENWGLVTYRETALLVDPRNSSASAKQRVAEVIDHELAHQWFGNLVTMEWWTDLWLNEGFASYMGPKAVDNQFPEWDLWTQFVVMEHLTALHDDSLRNTHPIEIDVKNPAEIREIFDHITYSKGSVVNRMLEHYLGEKVFQRGLRVYLKKYAYKNAKTVDLWAVLERVSKKPVRAIMSSFTRQGGYPLLHVRAKQEGRKMVLNISQERFLFDGGQDRKNSRWNAPIGVKAEGLKAPHFEVLKEKSKTIKLPISGWVKMNPEQSGFYRTAYDPAMLQTLLSAVEKGALSHKAVEYLGIADDAGALARAGFIKTSQALDILFALKNQTDYNIWVTVIGALRTIESLLSAEDRAAYARVCRSLIEPIFKKTGWRESKTASHSEILLRSSLIVALGHFEDTMVIHECRQFFKYFIEKGELNPNLRGAVYMVSAEQGGAQELEALLQLYRKTDLQEEKVRILRALTRFKGKDEIAKVLNFSLTKEVRNQDTYVVLAGFGGNACARRQNWEFVKAQWKELSKRYQGSSVGLLGHIMGGSTSGFTGKEELKDATQFFKAHPVEGVDRTVKQALEVIASTITWKARDEGDIHRWLQFRREA